MYKLKKNLENTEE